jgi:hypothetical protein
MNAAARVIAVHRYDESVSFGLFQFVPRMTF